MPNKPLLVERREKILTLTLNRPDKRNALTPDMLIQMYETLTKASSDEAVCTVIIRGAGEHAFSSGYDITAIPTRVSKELKALLDKKSPFELALDSIINYPYPVIAMLNGFAFGGACDLAIACDFRIAADDIQMGMVPARLGMVYFPEGLQRFIRTIGWPNTKEMFFTARRYKGRKLLDMGLVNDLVPREKLESATYALASEIAQNAPMALKGMKRIMNLIAASEALNPALSKEADALVEHAMTSEDLKEGQAAFIQKRKPEFKGK
jgi:enoyl-CoA hydratase/carnithine racemase